MCIKIIEASRVHLDVLSNVSARAYHDDPLFAWLYPSLPTRNNLKFLFRMGLIHDFRHGVVHTGESLEGFASWVPYEKAFMSMGDLLKNGLFSFLFSRGKVMKNISTYNEFVEERHRHHADVPHWYLHNLAVAPEHQNKGIASSLLAHSLEMIDAQHLPGYLETQNEKNIALYKRFGFTVVEGSKVPGTDHDLFFMFRDKR